MKEFSDLDIIIVDTAGRHIDGDLIDEMKQVSEVFKPDEIFLVMDATVGQQAGPQAEAFHDSVGVNGVILTKLDGSAKGGGALSAVAVTKAPIIFVGTGEGLDALETLDPDRFISRLLWNGRFTKTLLERAEEVMDASTAEDTAKRMMSGKFLVNRHERSDGIIN